MGLITVNHSDKGLARIIDKLDKEDFQKLVDVFLQESQQLEDTLLVLAGQKDIDTASGVWLDYIGKIVGEDRQGRTDEEYREALKLRIGINNSDGTPDIMISLVSQFTDATSVEIRESAIAFGTLYTNGQTNIGSTLFELVDNIKPTATKWLIHSDFDNNALKFSYEQSAGTSENFQVTNDGIVFDNFQVTLDGINFQDLFVTEISGALYPPSTGRDMPYYEEPDAFQVTSNGSDFEDFEVNAPASSNPVFGVVVPYDSGYIPDNVTPLCWEVEETSKNIA